MNPGLIKLLITGAVALSQCIANSRPNISNSNNCGNTYNNCSFNNCNKGRTGLNCYHKRIR